MDAVNVIFGYQIVSNYQRGQSKRSKPKINPSKIQAPKAFEVRAKVRSRTGLVLLCRQLRHRSATLASSDEEQSDSQDCSVSTFALSPGML
jgi:hypothetical protein